MGASTNTTHLLSLTYQAKTSLLQMAHKSALSSLTFLGPLPLSTISSLTVLLSSQAESTTSAFLFISSEMFPSQQSLAPDDPSPRKYTLCLSFFDYDRRSSGELFTVPETSSHHWEGRKGKISFFELGTDTDILWKTTRRGSVILLPSLLQGWLFFTSYFKVAAELFSIVFH